MVSKIEWHCTLGISECGMLHTIQVDDVITLLNAVHLVAAGNIGKHVPQGQTAPQNTTLLHLT